MLDLSEVNGLILSRKFHYERVCLPGVWYAEACLPAVEQRSLADPQCFPSLLSQKVIHYRNSVTRCFVSVLYLMLRTDFDV